MKILDRYLARTITVGTLVALFMLVSLDAMFALVNQIGDIGKGNYDWLHAILFVALGMPRRMYELFPTSMLLGSLLSLGTLANHSELIAMRAAGVPIAGIVRSTLKAGLLLMLAAMTLGELVAPHAEAYAQRMKTEARNANVSVQGLGNLWAKDGDRILHVQSVLLDHRLLGIKVFVLGRDMTLKQSISARSARYDDGEWTLDDVRRSIITPTGVTVETRPSERWKHLISPELFSVIVVEPQQMSAWALARYVAYLRANRLDARRYEYAFWSRFTVPLSSLVMLLLAMPFVFGSQRKTGFGQQLFVGIMVGLGFYLLSRLSGSFGLAYGLSPFLSAASPLLLFLAASLVALRRVR
ncbi:MAG: LPS export ABC transporter permease LptG [Gammaproteobacteria bacterium]